MYEGERDAHVRIGMDEVCCAIDRVDDEGRRGGEVQAWVIGFFAEKSEKEDQLESER